MNAPQYPRPDQAPTENDLYDLKEYIRGVDSAHGALSESTEDAGSKARERMALSAFKRAARKAALIAKVTILSGVLLALCCVGAFANWAWEHRKQAWLQDTRNCQAKVGDLELKGLRTYTYPYIEVLGYRFIDTQQIEESTKVFITGNGLSIMGLTNAQDGKGPGYWGLQVSDGVRDGQLLKPADTYVFMSGKNMAAVESKSFCH
jgi:hypothetical protein